MGDWPSGTSGIGVLVSGQAVITNLSANSGQYVNIGSGIGVIVQSGHGTLISGQTVSVASGVYHASGVGVSIQSGQGVLVQSGHGVLISGQTVVIASGTGILTQSGYGVLIQSGHGVLISGQSITSTSASPLYITNTLSSQLYLASGLVVSISGQMIDIDSGVYYASGVGVLVQSGHGVLISGQSVTSTSASPLYVINTISSQLYLASGLYVSISGQMVDLDSGVYYASGIGVLIQSGHGVLISGQTVAIASGAFINNQSGHGVIVQSGHGVLISGQAVLTNLAPNSGQYVNIGSGIGVTINISGYTAQMAPGQSLFVSMSGTGVASGMSGINIASTSASPLYIINTLSSQLIVASGLNVVGNFSATSTSATPTYIINHLSSQIIVASGLSVVGTFSATSTSAVPTYIINHLSSQIIVASGSYRASGVGVLVQSGHGVLVSGQTVAIASGAIIASGLNVVGIFSSTSASPVYIINHLSSQIIMTSGVYRASGVGVLVQSGHGVLISGQTVIAASGVYHASGIGVVIQSGVGVTLNSAAYVTPLPAGGIITRAILGTTAASGGQIICSSESIACRSLTLKSLSGTLYIGGTAQSNMPFIGYGMLITAGEAVTLEVNNFNLVRACAAVSGDTLSVLGVI